uniref:(northern house mosquito) hypothetical protein n=1 Tax=Culex pipiens TaxID=7175 RepID=A0A8D8GGD8_CULPI
MSVGSVQGGLQSWHNRNRWHPSHSAQQVIGSAGNPEQYFFVAPPARAQCQLQLQQQQPEANHLPPAGKRDHSNHSGKAEEEPSSGGRSVEEHQRVQREIQKSGRSTQDYKLQQFKQHQYLRDERRNVSAG